MEKLEQRVRRYLLARLRRRAVLDLYETAATAGLLERGVADTGTLARSWIVSTKARQFLTGARDYDRKIIGRMMGSSRGNREGDSQDHPGSARNSDDGASPYDWSTPAPPCQQPKPKPGRRTRRLPVGSAISFNYVAELLKEHLPPSSPMHVAVALLIARAVGTSLRRLSAFTGVVRSRTPFVLIKAPVARFEASVGMMLEEGLLLPFSVILEDVAREGSLSGRFRDNRPSKQQMRLHTLAGSSLIKRDDRTIRRLLRTAMTDAAQPILVADETPTALTPVIVETADLVVECDGFDRSMVADLLSLCIGVPSDVALNFMKMKAFDPQSLSIDDLLLAVRPGRSAEEVLTLLSMLIDRCSVAESDGKDTEDAGEGRGRSGGGKSRAKSAEKEKAGGSTGVEVILPEPPIPEAVLVDTDSPPLTTAKGAPITVETLCGYGAAQAWTRDLKADLELWREGALTWPEMSTKLLLSGPPGTGKTTFARALCNTLQVPLLVTSVANWLEPGFLGDVLQRMSAAFTQASKHAPAILFIDEIDNIGSRANAGSRQHDDYWVSLINRLLELLDGATKTEGVVIVGATNLPEKIDPALLRSGRLETHVRIPLPDVETLTGILTHHLGNDLPGVLASAPANRARLRPPAARNTNPQQLLKNSENRKASKGKGAAL
ncbi:ATP-binding protein [Ciceribacter sp. L1K22]|uniref:AAA family ATPase n=1 Tax=Ciceribacter sp. L1K22 TaxID=2820275 RepID=UPI001ABDC399|nr:ATP-binding protein [Ciceribacter sp. L1K22]MBO3762566.1 AAA family ATPase [Ciceribacter sp. L1K22]